MFSLVPMSYSDYKIINYSDVKVDRRPPQRRGRSATKR